MNLDDFAPVISSVASGISQISSGIKSWKNQQKQNEYNSAEAQKARDWQQQMYDRQLSDNIKLWNMQREYDTPLNQMNRFKEAGINPYFAMSQINSNLSTASGASFPASPQASPSGLVQQDYKVDPTFSQQALLLNQYKENINKTRAETDSILNQNSLYSLDQQLKELEVFNKSIEFNKGEVDLEILKKTRYEIINNIKTQNKLLGEQLESTLIDNTYKKIYNPLNIEITQENLKDLQFKNTYLNRAELQKITASTNEILSLISLNYAKEKETMSQVNINEVTYDIQKILKKYTDKEKFYILQNLKKYGTYETPQGTYSKDIQGLAEYITKLFKNTQNKKPQKSDKYVPYQSKPQIGRKE